MAWLAGIVFFVVISTANCKSDGVCQKTFCGEFCVNGYQMDENGCDTCQCLPDARTPTTCEQMACYAACNTGYQVKNHCPSCECAPDTAVLVTASQNVNGDAQADPCSVLYCIVPCESGYETDSQGCPTCTCIEDQSPTLKFKLKVAKICPCEACVQTGVDANMKKLAKDKGILESWKKALLRAFCRIARIPGCDKQD